MTVEHMYDKLEYMEALGSDITVLRINLEGAQLAGYRGMLYDRHPDSLAHQDRIFFDRMACDVFDPLRHVNILKRYITSHFSSRTERTIIIDGFEFTSVVSAATMGRDDGESDSAYNFCCKLQSYAMLEPYADFVFHYTGYVPGVLGAVHYQPRHIDLMAHDIPKVLASTYFVREKYDGDSMIHVEFEGNHFLWGDEILRVEGPDVKHIERMGGTAQLLYPYDFPDCYIGSLKIASNSWQNPSMYTHHGEGTIILCAGQEYRIRQIPTIEVAVVGGKEVSTRLQMFVPDGVYEVKPNADGRNFLVVRSRRDKPQLHKAPLQYLLSLPSWLCVFQFSADHHYNSTALYESHPCLDDNSIVVGNTNLVPIGRKMLLPPVPIVASTGSVLLLQNQTEVFYSDAGWDGTEPVKIVQGIGPSNSGHESMVRGIVYHSSSDGLDVPFIRTLNYTVDLLPDSSDFDHEEESEVFVSYYINAILSFSHSGVMFRCDFPPPVRIDRPRVSTKFFFDPGSTLLTKSHFLGRDLDDPQLVERDIRSTFPFLVFSQRQFDELLTRCRQQ